MDVSSATSSSFSSSINESSEHLLQQLIKTFDEKCSKFASDRECLLQEKADFASQQKFEKDAIASERLEFELMKKELRLKLEAKEESVEEEIEKRLKSVAEELEEEKAKVQKNLKSKTELVEKQLSRKRKLLQEEIEDERHCLAAEKAAFESRRKQEVDHFLSEPKNSSNDEILQVRRLFTELVECVAVEQRQMTNEHERNKQLLETQINAFEDKKNMMMQHNNKGHESTEDDIIDLNIGGEEFVSVRRKVLCIVKDSMLERMFSGRWDASLQRDEKGRVFLDYDPYLFKKILNFFRLKSLEVSGSTVTPLPTIETDLKDQYAALCDYLLISEVMFMSSQQLFAGKYLRSFGRNGFAPGKFSQCCGICVDANSIFVADYRNDCIQIFNKLGNFIGMFGSLGSGYGQFNGCLAIACDKRCIYVVDHSNHRIQIFRKKNGYYLMNLFGHYGSAVGQFQHPESIAVDDQHIFVTEWNGNRVQIFDKQSCASVGVIGTKGSAIGQFDHPGGICVDDSYIYVTDSGNSRVQVFLKKDNTFSHIIGSAGVADGQFKEPRGVCVAHDLLIVTDAENICVQVFQKKNGTFLQKFGEKGSANGQFSGLTGVAVDSEFIYFADGGNHRIQIFE